MAAPPPVRTIVTGHAEKRSIWNFVTVLDAVDAERLIVVAVEIPPEHEARVRLLGGYDGGYHSCRHAMSNLSI